MGKEKKVTCPKCSSRMFETSLNYESNGKDNFSVVEDRLFYKCYICSARYFPNNGLKRRVFVKGQKIKNVGVSDD
jgi:DNA-directed RNA polymerase subunit RPC12/RpoP